MPDKSDCRSSFRTPSGFTEGDRMTEQRRGEIALMYVRARVRDKGIRFGTNLRREIANEAHNLEIGIAEAAEFASLLVEELTKETLIDLDRIRTEEKLSLRDPEE